jgi:hypothetical protein
MSSSMSFSHPKTTLSRFFLKSLGVRSGPSSVGRKGTSAKRAFVKGNKSIFWFFFDTSGLRITSLRRADESKREEGAADVPERMDMLACEAPAANEDSPEENTVPVAPDVPELPEVVLLDERAVPHVGLS